jgi:hypothetical protein
MENSGEHYHVIVIGAGLSGLAAALQLAQHGHRVRMITATFICVPDGSCIETLFALFQSFACRMDTVSLPDSLFFFFKSVLSQSKNRFCYWRQEIVLVGGRILLFVVIVLSISAAAGSVPRSPYAICYSPSCLH